MKRVSLLLTLFMLSAPVSFLNAQTVTTTSDSTITSTETSSTDSTSKNTIDSTQTLKSPPPSAIAPSIGASSSDICTTGVSGAVQTQILGVSGGSSIRDFKDLSGKKGSFQKNFKVYQREGLKCKRTNCKGIIQKKYRFRAKELRYLHI